VRPAFVMSVPVPGLEGSQLAAVFQLSEVGTASHVPEAACEALDTNANPMIAAVTLRGGHGLG
jgi:hypothetical protein